MKPEDEVGGLRKPKGPAGRILGESVELDERSHVGAAVAAFSVRSAMRCRGDNFLIPKHPAKSGGTLYEDNRLPSGAIASRNADYFKVISTRMTPVPFGRGSIAFPMMVPVP